jgi:hypothetical protein
MTDQSQWPADKTKVKAIKMGAPDSMGRYHFDLLWWQDQHKKRAQCFHGPLNLKEEKDAYTWEEIKEARKDRRYGS